MADAKISQLTAATALAGTEVVPVVQSGTTKKATIDQILTPAAGKGIDFSANANAPGRTSELLDDYEEGTWTPVVTASSGAITTYTATGNYTIVGNRAFIGIQVSVTNNGTGAGLLDISLPFASAGVGAVSGQNANALTAISGGIGAGASDTRVARYDASYPVATGQTLRLFGHFMI